MKFATFDLETEGIGGDIIVIGAAYSATDGRAFGKDFSALLRASFDEEVDVLYAHFGGKFDFLYLLDFIFREVEYGIVNGSLFDSHGRIIAFEIADSFDRRIQFRDSFSLLPLGLNKLSNSLLGETKLIEDIENWQEYSYEQIEQYAIDDCIKLYKILELVASHFMTDRLSLTLGSQALSILMEMYNIDTLPFEKPNRAIYNFELSGNFGGHVDVYKRYASPVIEYDINSAYPYAAIQTGCCEGKGVLVSDRTAGTAGVYLVTAHINFFNPPLPKRLKHKGTKKLIFANGKTKFFVTDIFIDRYPHLIEKIHSGIEYAVDKSFFVEYMSHWYAYRNKGAAHNLVGKLLMNNLIGKFSIKRVRDSMMIGDGADIYYDVEKRIGKKKKTIDFWYSCPAVNSRITEFTRLQLFEYQNEIGHDHIVYSDTDSIYADVDLDGYHSKELGALKKEKSYERGYFLAPKLYGCFSDDGDRKIAAKGMFGREAVGESEIMNAYRHGVGINVSKISMSSWKMSAKTHQDFARAVTAKRTLKKFELKRSVLADLINTKPLIIS